jgi:hypothetical protein
MAEIDGRRFVTVGGLHEFDRSGKIIRSWWRETGYRGDVNLSWNLRLPPDCPIQTDMMACTGTLLVFAAGGSLTAWDPRTDTRYGPLASGGAMYVHGTRAGTWLTSPGRMEFVPDEAIVAAARGAGRVTATAQYRARQREAVAAMKPLDRAKTAFAMREFDVARKLLAEILRDDPQCAEALLLQGYMYDLWCTNQPDEALKYYRRLSDLNDPGASFSGMYLQLNLLRKLQRWPEALAAAEEILAAFPRLDDFHQRDVNWWRDHLRQELGRKDSKHLPAASNKREAGEVSHQ